VFGKREGWGSLVRSTVSERSTDRNEGGELVECATFQQNRAGLRALERWAKRFPERRWAVENAGGLGKHLAQRLSAAGESVVDVPPKLSARVRVLSTGNARKNDGLDALATALVARCNERLPTLDPEAAVEVLRLLSERREDLVAEHIGISPVGRWYAAAVEYLQEEGALELNRRTGNAVGQARYVLGERGPGLMEDL